MWGSCVWSYVLSWGSSLIGQKIAARPSHWPRVITHHFSQFRDVLWDKLASWRLECAMTGAESSYTILCYPSTYIGHSSIPFVIIFVITFCSSDCGPESESRWTIHHCWLHSRLLHRPHHCQPQHANTGKLSNLLRNIQNIINTRLMPPRVGANNEAEWSVIWSALDRITFTKNWHTFFTLSISNKYLSWRKDRIKFINVRIEPSQRVWEELGMSLGVRYTWEIFL